MCNLSKIIQPEVPKAGFQPREVGSKGHVAFYVLPDERGLQGPHLLGFSYEL